MSLVEFKNVSREFITGDTVVRAVNTINFDIQEGEFTVILGASGSGKSTTLNLIGGLDTPTQGEIRVSEKNIALLSDRELTLYRRDTIGFIFQFYNLLPNLTVFENVDISKRLSQSPLDTSELLDAVHLSDRKGHFPSKLSGGEMQRVSIARALCKNPKILLCDEPTGALDSETGKDILVLLRDTAKKYGITIVMVTHNEEIAKIANKVITMKDGEIVSVKINEHPRSPEEVEL